MMRIFVISLVLASVCAPAFAQQEDGTDLMRSALGVPPISTARDKGGNVNLECKAQTNITTFYDGHQSGQQAGQETHALSLNANKTFSDLVEETGVVRTGSYTTTPKRYILQYKQDGGVLSGSGFIDRESGDISSIVTLALSAPQTMTDSASGYCDPQTAKPKF